MHLDEKKGLSKARFARANDCLNSAKILLAAAQTLRHLVAILVEHETVRDYGLVGYATLDHG